MSQENVELLVHRLAEAWNRSDVEAVLALFDSECEVVFQPEVPEPGPFHGHAELRQWAGGFLAAWEFHHSEVVEIVDAGDSVVAVLHLVGRGIGSGVEMDETDDTSSRSGREGSFAGRASTSEPTPSKPWGCRSRTMSRENVEIVRAIWEPFKGVDATEIDWEGEAIREMIVGKVSPEVELRWAATNPETRVYRGRDGVIHALREWVEPFSEYRTEPLDYIDAGDRVVVPMRQWGSGRQAEFLSRSRSPPSLNSRVTKSPGSTSTTP